MLRCSDLTIVEKVMIGLGFGSLRFKGKNAPWKHVEPLKFGTLGCFKGTGKLDEMIPLGKETKTRGEKSDRKLQIEIHSAPRSKTANSKR